MSIRRIFVAALAAFASAAGAAGDETAPPAAAPEPEAAAPASSAASVAEGNGLRIAFDVRDPSGEGPIRQGGVGVLRFTVTDLAAGTPVEALYPAAWVDAGAETALDRGGCGARASQYLSGLLGVRPMVDLNSYFVLVMNRDATISVIDPILGVSGITKLYDEVILPRPGGDWVQSADGKELYVSMPRADAVAVVALETFSMVAQIETGPDPLRVGLQPDGRYLWVGHGGPAPGVTAIDVATRAVVAEIPTGAGHKEFAFTDDSARVIVTNREAGPATVIDVASLAVVAQIPVGEAPIAVAWSGLSALAFVADGESGRVIAIDPAKAEAVGEITLAPGLGPIRATPDGRWLLAPNPAEDTVYAIDAATREVRHRIRVTGRPYRIGFSRSFAYVRALDSASVSMIELDALSNVETMPPLSFPAGDKPPSAAQDLSLADVITEAPGEAAVLVTSPADRTVFYYMEGMNAPMGSFRNYGHQPRAATVVDRSINEVAPGVYEAPMKLPVAGPLEAIFLVDSPRLLHCFRFEVAANDDLGGDDGAFRLVFDAPAAIKAGVATTLRFRLVGAASASALTDLGEVSLLSFRSPGADRTVTAARSLGEGIYEFDFTPRRAGAYYFYASSTTRDAAFGASGYATLVVRDAGAAGSP